MTIIEKAEKILSDPLENEGYIIVRIRAIGQTKITLQIMIERINGLPITLDDCTKVSRQASVLLDVQDFRDAPYVLEVSSTGLERPLVKLKDFDRFKEHQAMIQLHSAVENQKKWVGVLKGLKDEQVLMEIMDGEEARHLVVDFANIKNSHLCYIIENKTHSLKNGGRSKKKVK